MKKVLILISVFIAIMLASCNSSTAKVYTREEMQEAIASAEKRGFEEAYAEAEYYARMEIEKALKEEAYYANGEIEQLRREIDDAYDAGYEKGYSDCLEEHGLYNENVYMPNKER